MSSGGRFRNEVFRYLYGGILSLFLTLIVYSAVVERQWQAGTVALVALVAAAVQFVIQSRYFLHVTKSGSSMVTRMSLVFTGLMLLIIVVGSLWVMININYNMGMSAEQMEQYMRTQNKKGF